MRRRAALAVVIIVAAFVFPAVYEAGPYGEPSIARATPSLSGAKALGVINGEFSGIGAGDVGTPPANYEFDASPGTVGTPPSNHDFETGDFTDWTLTGSPVVNSGGPTGYYAQLGASQKILSAAFTVASNAQTLTVQAAAVSGGTFQLRLNIYSGGSYATKTIRHFSSCPTTCTNWNTFSADIVAFQGQSIKLEVERYLGDVKVDNVGIGVKIVPSWSAANGERVSVQPSGPSGNYLSSTTTLTSPAFTVDSLAQNGKIDIRVLAGNPGTYSVRVLSGGSYATSTTVFSGSAADSGSWETKRFGIGNWVGQSIKLQIVPGATATLGIDNPGITENVIPGWDASGIYPAALSNSAPGYAVGVGGLTSQEMTLDFSSPFGGIYATWFRIVYQMKANYNSGGTDLGSTLDIWWKTSSGEVAVFTAAGREQGHPYDPTDVWLEKYFAVYSTSPATGSFRIDGWGPTVFGCNPSCGGRPDVMLIERIDGPVQNKVVGSPEIMNRGAIPPGLMNKPLNGSTQDPVEVTSGNYYHTKTDLAIPGRGIPLTWTRSYSAQGSLNGVGVAGPMGAKWAHNWEMRLQELTDDTRLVIHLPMGAKQFWNKISGTWTPPAGNHSSLVENMDGSWTLTTAEQLVYTFDSAGLWTAVADRNGNTTTLAYSSGKLTTITDPGSRELEITWGTMGTGDGRIVEVSDGTRSVYYDYDAAGDLVEVTDVMGESILFEYEGHRLTKATDARGNDFVRNTYDLFGRVVEQRDALNGLTTIAYDTPGAGATRVTDPRNKQTTYYFDTQHRITDIEDHDGEVVSFVYDSANNRTSVTNQLGKTWSYTYDGNGNVLTATDPLTKTWTYTYDGDNNLLSVTDPLTKETEFTYDGNGNLLEIEDADDEVTTFTVDGNGQVTEIEDALEHTTTFTYDAYGNRETVTNALEKTWTYTYDTLGRVLEVEDPLEHVTTFTYNAANLVLTVTDELEHTTTYTYDENGNVRTVTDAEEHTTTYDYDAKDQLVSILDAEEGEWTFGYDAVGNLTSKTNPRGKTTSYTYDNLGRLLTETDPLTLLRSYAYDEAGRLTSRTDPKSQTIGYVYNDRDQLTLIDYPAGADVSFAYNDTGVRTSMTDATGTTTYAYDDLYRLTSVTFPGSRVVAYGYDAIGRRTSLTYPGGSDQVTYGYDDANQLTSVTDWESNAIGYAYDDAGRLTSKTLPSGTGIVTTYTYDDADRLTGIAHVKDGTTTVASVAYTLDDVGNRTQRVDQQGTHTYAYDDLYRLTSVTYPGPTTTTYAYDAFGNRESMTTGAGTTTYDYDDGDRLLEVQPPAPASPIAYDWDDNGNLIERGVDTFEWDYEDRLVEATVNAVTTSFIYRGDGLRDSRTVGMTTTTFTWDLNAGLPVVLDDGNRYVYGAGLEAMKASGEWYYYLADGLGSTMAIVDDTGTEVKSYTYDVYGEATPTGALANEYDFAGQATDASTGLQYLRARYYDPETGSFISRDPLESINSWTGNPFGYAATNPVRLIDSGGLRPTEPDDLGAGNCSQGCWRWHPSAGLERALKSGIWTEALRIDGQGNDPLLIRFCSFVGGEKTCSAALLPEEASIIGEYNGRKGWGYCPSVPNNETPVGECAGLLINIHHLSGGGFSSDELGVMAIDSASRCLQASACRDSLLTLGTHGYYSDIYWRLWGKVIKILIILG